ncbi:hypothetical protein K438DRAFT_1786236 [Mycena galopus ATCC 62051]|nr:hypothetical protein K438DRAFT_1786236 [Mycena galopus ATCC 62051]
MARFISHVLTVLVAGAIAVQSLQTCDSADLLCPIVNGVKYQACGEDCYMMAEYTCFNGNFLCPYTSGGIATQACGDACYSPYEYSCNNGQLTAVPSCIEDFGYNETRWHLCQGRYHLYGNKCRHASAAEAQSNNVPPGMVRDREKTARDIPHTTEDKFMIFGTLAMRGAHPKKANMWAWRMAIRRNVILDKATCFEFRVVGNSEKNRRINPSKADRCSLGFPWFYVRQKTGRTLAAVRRAEPHTERTV